MRRQSPYDAGVNPYVASHMQHISAHRMQHNAGLNSFSGRQDSHPTEEDYPYKSSKPEGHWQWSRDAPKTADPMSSHPVSEGLEGNGTRSFYHSQMPESNLALEKQANKESNIQPHEQDMEIGFGDNPLYLNFEGFEKKFLDEITKLTKEQNDAEDAENVRHRELFLLFQKVIEINTRYQEKLSSLRTRQANQREEFLHKESQARLHQYQQAGMSNYPNSTGLGDAHSYGGAAGEIPRAYASGHYDSYRERPQFMGHGRSQGAESRVPYPEGRVYNTGGRYY